MDLTSVRRDFLGPRLLESNCPVEPWSLFDAWLRKALEHPVLDATAMVLSTVGAGGVPSSRVVLLKEQDGRSLVFFTRYSTQKGTELRENPHGSLLFHWRELDRQVRITGRIERTSPEESRAYFKVRPRLSQLAAWAASGLTVVSGADELERRFAEASSRWMDREVQMPEDWGGYRTVPSAFEFWQGRPNRLHDRLSYQLRSDGSWVRDRLGP